jgi:hypothetical protein
LGGGAARVWPPEHGHRREVAEAGAGARCGEATEGKRARREHGEDRQLTLSATVKTARPGRLGNDGERWWPESGKRARFGHLGPSRLACVDEERQGDAAKLRGGSVDFGDSRRRWGRGRRRALLGFHVRLA